MLCFPRLGDYGYLGNAMFQYSALLGVANKTGFNPVYDFNKKGIMCTLHESFSLNKTKNIPHHEQVHGIRKIMKEPHFNFSEDMFSVEDNVGLNGYFQSEKYFKHIENDIRSEFQFSKELVNECEGRIKEAKAGGAETIVGVHVRLGDYKNLEHIYVPLIKTDYYQKAFQFMDSNITDNKMYIIFSDEIEICQQLFKGDNVAFAQNGTPTKDMCLMSMCDHNIIANSSFGWWGAWLNNNKDKKVIAPINWFIPEQKEPKDTKDLYCDEWLKL